MTDDTCDKAQTAPDDFNNYDCTLGGKAPNFNNGCWTKAGPTDVTRDVKCYKVETDGNTLTRLDDTSQCSFPSGNYTVYRVDTTTTASTVPTASCDSPTDDGKTPCVFKTSAPTFTDVLATRPCTDCTVCPTYAIGVGPFATSP